MGSPGIPILQSTINSSLLPLLGMLGGYLVVMRTNPVRVALRDGFRCIMRFKRIWLLFAVLALAYSAFQFVVFSPLQSSVDLRLEQFAFWESWHWPRFSQVWRESLLHTAESVAGIFDAAATTYPLSVLAALLLILNWRGLHRSLVRRFAQAIRFGRLVDLFWGVAQRACFAAQAADLLAAARSRGFSLTGASPADLGRGRYRGFYF